MINAIQSRTSLGTVGKHMVQGVKELNACFKYENVNRYVVGRKKQNAAFYLTVFSTGDLC